MPHYLRFARAAALVSGLAALPGCYADHLRPEDAPDAAVPDAPQPDTGPVDPCDTCMCDGSWTHPPRAGSCEDRGLWMCCPVVGPLAPPDLPA